MAKREKSFWMTPWLYWVNEASTSNEICGVMLETFQGWGAVFYPKDFVKALEKFCRSNNVLWHLMKCKLGLDGRAKTWF